MRTWPRPMQPGLRSVGGGDARRLLAPARLAQPRGLFGRYCVGEVAERERSVRATPPIGSEEPLFLTVPLRPTPEGPKHAVQPLLRTVVAIMWVDCRADLEGAFLPPGAIGEIVQSSSKRGRTLAVRAGDLLPPLRCPPCSCRAY
jgi:hypothetical protein